MSASFYLFGLGSISIHQQKVFGYLKKAAIDWENCAEQYYIGQ